MIEAQQQLLIMVNHQPTSRLLDLINGSEIQQTSWCTQKHLWIYMWLHLLITGFIGWMIAILTHQQGRKHKWVIARVAPIHGTAGTYPIYHSWPSRTNPLPSFCKHMNGLIGRSFVVWVWVKTHVQKISRSISHEWMGRFSFDLFDEVSQASDQIMITYPKQRGRFIPEVINHQCVTPVVVGSVYLEGAALTRLPKFDCYRYACSS